jgi:hypothetical protein
MCTEKRSDKLSLVAAIAVNPAQSASKDKKVFFNVVHFKTPLYVLVVYESTLPVAFENHTNKQVTK